MKIKINKENKMQTQNKKPELTLELKKLFKNVRFEKPNSGLRPPRKNLAAVAKMVNLLAEEGVKSTTSGEIWHIIQKVGPSKIGFELNQDTFRMDQHGPARSIGDILGGHGLKLKKIGRGRYQIPTNGITNDYLISIDINPKHEDFA